MSDNQASADCTCVGNPTCGLSDDRSSNLSFSAPIVSGSSVSLCHSGGAGLASGFDFKLLSDKAIELIVRTTAFAFRNEVACKSMMYRPQSTVWATGGYA